MYLAGAGALLVDGAPAVGGDAALVEFVDELRVEIVGVGQGEALPRHRDDDDPRQGAAVARALLDETQHFLLQRRPADDLQCRPIVIYRHRLTTLMAQILI